MKRALLFLAIAGAVVASLSAQGPLEQARRGPWITVARHPDTNVYCSNSVSPLSVSAPSTAGTQVLTITANTGCAWVVVSNIGFITVTAGASGTGNGTATIAYSANAGTFRVGTVTAAGQTVSVNQNGASSGGCVPTSASYIPCASGPGMETRAAWACGGSPTLYKVTKLTDTLPHGVVGELRYALEKADDPNGRLVVFETSGTITAVDAILVSRGCLTVAGQTAPSPGIMVKGFDHDSGIEVHDADVVMQHYRVRPGHLTCNSALGVWDSANWNNVQAAGQRIVFDHMSVSWGVDENVYVSTRNRQARITVWRSFMTEGLEDASGGLLPGCVEQGATNGHGLLVYYTTQAVAAIQNVFAHNLERNPYCAEACSLYFANNVVYDGHEDNFVAQGLWGLSPNQPTFYTSIGNYFRQGSTVRGGTPDCIFCFYGLTAGLGNQVYDSGNVIDNNPAIMPAQTPLILFNGSIDARTGVTTPPITVAGYVPSSALTAYQNVPLDAGARYIDRAADVVDARIVSEMAARSGFNINSEVQVGGFPTLAVNTRTFTLVANPNVVQPSGYTNAEIQLQAMATAVEH